MEGTRGIAYCRDHPWCPPEKNVSLYGERDVAKKKCGKSEKRRPRDAINSA